jgi:16S rRNA (cytidine1402-2'-O)-methyltransferase
MAMAQKKGKILLIPSLLGETEPDKVLPAYTIRCAQETRFFLVENLREARRFLSKLGMPVPITELNVAAIPEHENDPGWKDLLSVLLQGENIGVISDAGCPGVADPGSLVVQKAHALGIEVEPLVGPSSFLLAIMAAGFNGQSFCFHGYLPIEKQERKKILKRLEEESQRKGITQMFMETPYRNQALLQTLKETCRPETYLCVAAGLSTNKAFIESKPLKDWKLDQPQIHKVPAVFLIFVR